MGWVQILLLAALAAALGLAALIDWRTRTIPNPLNATIALAAPLWWWASGIALWPDVALQFGIALAVFTLFAGFFAIGAMGGGDVKLIAALALWLPFLRLIDMLFVMAVVGGILTLAMLAGHRLARKPGRPEIPYGIAIAVAGLWVIANSILTSFGH